MTAFRGNYSAKVEDGGRLKIPGPFKKLLDDANVTQVYITSTDGKSAEIWPLPEWEKQEGLISQSPLLGEALKKYVFNTSYFGHQTELDKQARVVLPQLLRKSAGLDEEVFILGSMNRLLVINQKKLDSSLEANALTENDNKVLEPLTNPRVGG